VPEVRKAEEIQFATYPYYEWAHCTFRITLVSGEQYAFDPTGVQFGPLWALLSPWTEYQNARVYNNMMVEEPLGQEAQDKENAAFYG
jgi:hypothetical protein